MFRISRCSSRKKANFKQRDEHNPILMLPNQLIFTSSSCSIDMFNCFWAVFHQKTTTKGNQNMSHQNFSTLSPRRASASSRRPTARSGTAFGSTGSSWSSAAGGGKCVWKTGGRVGRSWVEHLDKKSLGKKRLELCQKFDQVFGDHFILLTCWTEVSGPFLMSTAVMSSQTVPKTQVLPLCCTVQPCPRLFHRTFFAAFGQADGRCTSEVVLLGAGRKPWTCSNKNHQIAHGQAVPGSQTSWPMENGEVRIWIYYIAELVGWFLVWCLGFVGVHSVHHHSWVTKADALIKSESLPLWGVDVQEYRDRGRWLGFRSVDPPNLGER